MKSHLTPANYRTALSWLLALPILYVISRNNYNLFHSLADGATIVIAASAFTIIWNSRQRVDNGYFLYTSIAFLFFAILDLIHMLGNKNMGVFPASYGNLGPTFYIASRYVLSISLFIAPFFIRRKLNTTLLFAVYSAVTALILLSVFTWNIFPACFVEGVGLTPFKVISDYVICLILLGAMALLLINRQAFDPRVLKLIVASLILSIATGLTFTLYSDPFGITNTLGHFFQIASFYLIYLAFIETSLTKPQEILFRKLKQNEEQLTENLKRLDAANAELNQEIAERRRAEEELRESERRYRELCVIDGLTQLYNSRHFYDQLKSEIERSIRYKQPLTMLLLDLDDFKAFNDNYGHVEGDQVLWRLGQVIKSCLRQTDSAYRYGGEEFTILLPMTTSAHGAITAERIRAELKKETFSPVPGQDVHVTVSIGLAQYKPQEDMKAFVQRVDQLMYHGKKDGKDRVCSE